MLCMRWGGGNHDSKSLFTIIVAYMVQSVSSLWVRNFQFREHGRLPPSPARTDAFISSDPISAVL